MTKDQLMVLATVSLGILEAVAVAGEQGAPGGVLYAAMQAQGATHNQFQSIMGTMTKPGYLVLEDNCYRSTSSTPELITKLTRILAAIEV